MTKPKWTEAKISIGGRELTFAEAMTVRVALTSYEMSLVEGDLANLTPSLREGYMHNARSVLQTMAQAAEHPETQVLEP